METFALALVLLLAAIPSFPTLCLLRTFLKTFAILATLLLTRARLVPATVLAPAGPLALRRPLAAFHRIQRACSCCPALTYQQRLVGFVMCFAAGMVLSLTSLFSFTSLLLGNPTPFALKYTLGNLLAMGASSFLVGPVKQCTDMFAPERRVATSLYAGSLLATLTCIFYLHSKLLTFVAICCQLCAMVWYFVSYLPFGQKALQQCLRGMRFLGGSVF